MKKLDVPQSGSQADTVASRNRFGQYNRTRAMPVQPRTAAQLAVRANLTDASQAWRALTDAVRAAWAAYAATTPKTDSLGQTVFPTGHQAFVSLFVALAQAGLSTPPDVPIDPPPAPPVITGVDAEDDGTLEISLSGAVPADTYALIDAGEQVSAGVTFFRDFRRLTVAAPASTSPLSISGGYVARWGALILGRRIFFRVRFLTETGGVSAEAVASTVVVAAGP